jgi:release factor glutamine methyltransferase
MLLLRPPGVYRPQADTRLLAEVLREGGLRGARVLDLCTGTGAVALAAASAGAAQVTAVDVSWGAALAARANAALHRLPLRVRRGDLCSPVAGERFDVIAVNPPYVPSSGPPPRHGRARAWDAGPQGRELLDRVCAGVPRMLTRSGTLFVVQSTVSGEHRTLGLLRHAGLKAAVVRRSREPFGPVMRRRAGQLAVAGLIGAGQCEEELVVIRADRTEPR